MTLVRALGQFWFWAERQFCRIPGFMTAYGDASQAWSDRLDARVEGHLAWKEQNEP